MLDRPKQGTIIYIDFDPSAGSEIRKRRPAVVVSEDILQKTSKFVWVAPISHGHCNGRRYPLHVSLDSRTKIDGTIYVEQTKSLDYVTRNWEFVEYLPKDLLETTLAKAKLVLQLNK